jgi:hypothetical protein
VPILQAQTFDRPLDYRTQLVLYESTFGYHFVRRMKDEITVVSSVTNMLQG